MGVMDFVNLAESYAYGEMVRLDDYAARGQVVKPKS